MREQTTGSGRYGHTTATWGRWRVALRGDRVRPRSNRTGVRECQAAEVQRMCWEKGDSMHPTRAKEREKRWGRGGGQSKREGRAYNSRWRWRGRTRPGRTPAAAASAPAAPRMQARERPSSLWSARPYARAPPECQWVKRRGEEEEGFATIWVRSRGRSLKCTTSTRVTPHDH